MSKIFNQPFLSFRAKRKGSKVMETTFSFCRTCFVTNSKGECFHSLRNRGWTSNFSFVELNAAIGEFFYEMIEEPHELLLYQKEDVRKKYSQYRIEFYPN